MGKRACPSCLRSAVPPWLCPSVTLRLVRMQPSAQRRPERTVGQFVLFPNSPGVGRVAEVDEVGRRVLVQFFESVADPAAASVWVDESQAKHCRLGVQTRVFVKSEHGWWAGRVVGGGPQVYAVRKPNMEYDLQVPEDVLRVRWERPPEDPLQVLLAGAQETPYFRDSRLPVRHLLLQERAATASATGIMSAGVNLHAHQVNAAMRILQDPTQRYLLADEVGMGKTIQAGFVIRQHLIDEQEGCVGILVPQTLVAQWEDELREKFFIDDFTDSSDQTRVRVVAHEHPASWERLNGCSLLVVDEAHLLANAKEPTAEPYAKLSLLAASVPRILLVSATPSTQSDATHLALLHLLDPDMYKWSEMDRFCQLRSVNRRLGLAIYGLDVDPDPDNPELLQFQLDEIAALIPHDSRFEELRGALMSSFRDGSLAADVSEADLNHRVAAIRAHIAETYRLHHRVIRHRRQRVLGASLDDEGVLTPFEVTGRTAPRRMQLASVEAAEGAEVVDSWLSMCSRYLADSASNAEEFGVVLGVLVSRLGGPVNDLVDVLSIRLEGAPLGPCVDDAEREALLRAPRFPGEDRLLARLRNVADTDGVATLADRLTDVLARHKVRAVVFCGRGQLADTLAKALAAKESVPVFRHLSGDPTQAEQSVREWKTTYGLLVTDQSGDVGRNLQDAQVVVHARVPWNPNLLEQRIGRVDRYGNHDPAAQYVVADSGDNGVHSAWISVLSRGFGVFDHSISTLQEPIERLTPRLWGTAVSDGIEAFLRTASEVEAELAKEARSVAETDTLEAAAEFDSLGRDLTLAMSRFESDPAALEQAYVRLLTEPIGFRLNVRERLDGSVAFESSTDAPPLLSPRMLTRLETRETARTGVFDRWALRSTRGRRLFRRGNPFLDGVESILELDDRGLASALLRFDARWEEDPIVYLGCDFLVQADIAEAVAVVGADGASTSPLRRRADLSFPPFSKRVWVASDGSGVVSDESTLAFLDAPYIKRPRGRDINLSTKRIGEVHDLFGGQDAFSAAATRMEAQARAAFIESSGLQEICSIAAERMRAQGAVLAAQAQARQAAGQLVADVKALELDRDLTAALVGGIEAPQVRLMAVSCLVRVSARLGAHGQG